MFRFIRALIFKNTKAVARKSKIRGEQNWGTQDRSNKKSWD